MTALLLGTIIWSGAQAQTGTLAEFTQAMDQFESAFETVLKIKIPDRRAEIAQVDLPTLVSELDRWEKSIWPVRAITPPRRRFDPNVLEGMTEGVQKPLRRLIERGFVPANGPLTSNKPLTAERIGDAVGYFISRTAEITHQPSRKFTPALMD